MMAPDFLECTADLHVHSAPDVDRRRFDDIELAREAAAVHGGAPIIVTFNLRHFRSQHLEPWGIRALHPQSFLVEIFRQEEQVVFAKLEQQAADRGRTLRQLLDILSATVPEFVAIILAAISRQ